MALHDEFVEMEGHLDDPVLAEHLDTYLDADPDTIAEVQSMFGVRDLAHADQVLRRLARVRRNLARAEDLYETQVAQLRQYIDAERHRAGQAEERLTWLLESFHRAVLAEDPKAKTVRLPSGELVARKAPDRWDFDDEAFLAWAADHHPEFVRTKVEVDKPTVKKALVGGVVDRDADNGGGLIVARPGHVISADGEVVPGVEVTPGEVRFTAKTEVDR